MITYPRSLVCFAILALLCGSKLVVSAAPNVLLILSDNQSYYEMGCHGYTPLDGAPSLSTPNIDSLAASGVDFQNFYAASYCSPSRSILMTGKHSIRTGVYDTYGGRSIMHKDDDTIAEIMKANGYKTSIYGKWHLGFSYPHRPADRGFEETYVLGGGSLGQLEDYYGNKHLDPVFYHNGVLDQSTGYSTDVLFTKAKDWIQVQQQNGDPFFCFISTPAVHGPYLGPDGETGSTDAIPAIIENLDTNIGSMLTHLDTLGIADDTIVIFASDQGMFDRGAPHLTVANNFKETSQDARHHIPFMIRMDGVTPRIETKLAGLIDFVPTMLDLCNIPIPADMNGISLKPLLTGNPADYPADRTLIVQCPRGREAKPYNSFSVKTDRWRLDGKVKLFDKIADPRCTTNVYYDYPTVAADLRAKYDAFWASMPDPATTLSRNQIGAPGFPDTTMTGMDWYEGEKTPWGQSHIARTRDLDLSGPWAVSVMQSGTYTFKFRQYPAEAPQPLALSKARIKIGDIAKEWLVDPTATSTSVSVTLTAGDYDLQSWMIEDDASEFGATFVEITKEAGPVDPSYQLTVDNGTGDGVYTGGRIIDVEADPSPAGKHFYSWLSENGGTFANSASGVTTFTVPYAISSAMTIGATYDYDSDDVDSDQVWDSWEIFHFGSVVTVDGTQDFDLDGVSDYDEFIAGIDPDNQANTFRVLEESLSAGGDVRLRFSSNDDLSSRRYKIMYTDDITDSDSWAELPLGAIEPSSGDYTERTFSKPEGFDTCFFKVESFLSE